MKFDSYPRFLKSSDYLQYASDSERLEKGTDKGMEKKQVLLKTKDIDLGKEKDTSKVRKRSLDLRICVFFTYIYIYICSLGCGLY